MKSGSEMKAPRAAIASNAINSLHKQAFRNGEVHDWYRIILGYSDHLVGDLIDRFELKRNHRILDPFCGTGTTLVESMKRGFAPVGIEANPSSCFAARVKTTWGLSANSVAKQIPALAKAYQRHYADTSSIAADPAYVYMTTSGMVDRGWISPTPLKKVIAIKKAIGSLHTSADYKRLFTLALVSELVGNASNVKFGPELYCSDAKRNVDVVGSYLSRIEDIARDLEKVRALKAPRAQIIGADSRRCGPVLRANEAGTFDCVITSPPYPAEHDYTRNSRLELALLGCVSDIQSLRTIKQAMIRSHTKGIYVTDRDNGLGADHPALQEIIRKIGRRAAKKTHGFARLYPSVVAQYFGGMKRHLKSLRGVLRKDAVCAYIVGDQSSYLRVPIPTAEILGSIAEELGYKVIDIEEWRVRWSTTTSRNISENILLFRKT